MRRLLGSLVIAFAVLGCDGGGSGVTGTGEDPPPVSCEPTISECDSSTECCGTCFYGYCMPSVENGKCVTTDDCQDPLVCVSKVCKTATCRQDLDVCTDDAQCCVGNCRGNGRCGVNRPPLADLGADRTVDRGVSVSLYTGTVTDPDGDPLTYSWSLTPPGGSAAVLSSATSPGPNFLPDVAGPYAVTVTVGDGQYTASDSVVLTAVNAAPVARAVGPASAPRNTLVQLDASTSSDLNGDSISFSWTLSGPAGSAATLSSTTDPRPTFTPDLLGDFTATVTASDGQLTSSASVTVSSTNTAPIARITALGALNAGESVTLSAETSSDQNGDPLTYTWSFTGPIGNAATLSGTSGATVTLDTDKAGSYTVTVVASDGVATHSTYAYVQAHPHVMKLPHDVVAAAYSKAIDRLLLLSTTPSSSLWIVDPATETEQRVDLPLGPPLSVGVSADGAVAVVGRNGGITAVDLVTATVTGDCPTEWTDPSTSTTYPYDVGQVAVGPVLTIGKGGSTRTTRFAYAAPGQAPNRGPYTMALGLDLCDQTIDWFLSTYGTITAGMRHAAGQFWVRDGAYGSDFYVYPVPTGSLVTRIWAEPEGDGYTGAGFWFTEDGGRMVVEEGDVYDPNPGTSAYQQKPLARLGALGNPAPYTTRQLVLHADHCAACERISIVPMNDWGETTADTVLKSYSAYASSPGSYAVDGPADPLPTIVIDGGLHQARGRWVYYRSDGSARYAVIRTAPEAAVTLFAIASMGP